MKSFALILGLFWLLASTLGAQQEMPIEKINWLNDYSDGIETGKLFMFEPYFESDPVTFDLFKSYNRTRKAELLTYTICGGAVLVGVLGTLGCAQSSNEFCFVGPILLGVAGASTVLLTLPFFSVIRNKKRKKAVKSLNAFYGALTPKHNNTLAIMSTSNGVGLVLTF